MAEQEQALLGLATTRELLQEIKVRAATGMDMDNGSIMYKAAHDLLEDMPEKILEYRTVGSK